MPFSVSVHPEVAIPVDVWQQGASASRVAASVSESDIFLALQEKYREPPIFFPVDEKMALVPAAILGFQHMIAMLIGCGTVQLLRLERRRSSVRLAASSRQLPFCPITPTTRAPSST
jgi:hypothetical protein